MRYFIIVLILVAVIAQVRNTQKISHIRIVYSVSVSRRNLETYHFFFILQHSNGLPQPVDYCQAAYAKKFPGFLWLLNRFVSLSKFEIQSYLMFYTCKKYASPDSNITLLEYLKTVREIANETRKFIQSKSPHSSDISNYFVSKMCDYCVGNLKKKLLIKMAQVQQFLFCIFEQNT